MKFIGLDIGTTTICGVLFDAERSEVIQNISRPNDSWIATANDWERIQNPEIVVEIVNYVLYELAKNCPNPDGIGVTGQMHGVVYVNSNGRHVSPLYTWQDKRGDLPYKDTSTSSTYSTVLSDLTGYTVPSGYGLATHFYHVMNEAVPPAAISMCTIADYIAMRLTGRQDPLVDATNAASMGVFHLLDNEFDEDAIRRANIAPTMLPRVISSASLVGYWGTTPVISALGDNQASYLGSVRSIKDSVLVNVGTGGQVSVFSESPDNTNSQLEVRPFPGGGYLRVGATLSGGKSYAILETFFRQVCESFAGVKLQSLYEKMEHIIENTEQKSDKLFVSPQFFGTRQDPHKSGAISNILPENFTPECLILGFLEGMTNELLTLYQMFPYESKTRIKTLVGSGNAVRKSPGLRHALENQFGMRLQIPFHLEEAAMGAALCAGVGTGFYQIFQEAGRALSFAR